jgi:hypothetical protein
MISPVEGLSTLDYLLFLLKKLPAVAFTSVGYSSWMPTDAKVSLS